MYRCNFQNHGSQNASDKLHVSSGETILSIKFREINLGLLFISLHSKVKVKFHFLIGHHPILNVITGWAFSRVIIFKEVISNICTLSTYTAKCLLFNHDCSTDEISQDYI